MSQSRFRVWLNQKVANWQAEYHQHGRTILKSGLGYGMGLVLGALLSNMLFRTVDPDWFINNNDVQRLIVGLILAFVITGVGGGVSGFIGGMTLPMPEGGRRQATTAAMSALGMAVLFSLLIFPLILVIGLLSYYDVAELRPRLFGFVLGLDGLLYGLLMGLWLGVTTIGSWRAGRVARPAAVGFGLGGFLFGCGVWAYLYTLSSRDVQRTGWIWLLLGLFAFAALGGGALGLAYGRLSTQSETRQPLQTTFRRTVRRYWLIAVIFVFAAWYLHPIFVAIGDMLTPNSAGLAGILPSQTLGTHWSDPTFLPEESGTPPRSQPDLYAVRSSVVLTWVQANAGGPGEVYYSTASSRQDGTLGDWQTAVNVSASLELDSSASQVVIDNNGIIYLTWVEESAPQQSTIHIVRCHSESCSSPMILSAEQDGLDCSWVKPEDRQQNFSPRLAINGDQIMLIWHSVGQMLYSNWSTLESNPQPKANCLLLPEVASNSVSLVTGPGDGFSLAYSAANAEHSIYQLAFAAQNWGLAQPVGQGGDPALYVDNSGNTHLASCGLDQALYYQSPQGSPQQVSSMTCLGSPDLLSDSQGNLHLLWVSQSVVNTQENVSSAVMYETKQTDGVWQPEVLVFAGISTPDLLTQFSAMQDSSGDLHLAWPASGLDNSLGYATQVQYSCPDLPENKLAQVVYQAAAPYRSPQTPPPYCGNRYERLIFAPNPKPAFSDQAPSPNGAFDKLSESIRLAQYEVLLSTMWYESDLNRDSPGAVVASAVADLYHQVKQHPERYPRGMTVRILLGNPPEVVMDETSDQLWSLLNDLRNAGVEEMSNPQIGWQVETANFEGAMPHSHSKMLIVDGKSIVAAGFNFEYYHYPIEHPSGLGEDRWDLAMQISGPVAQDAMRAYDDLWQDSNGRECNFHPELDLAWETTCHNYPVKAVHIPEVLKYYLPAGGAADAFSMFRTEVHGESDAEVVAVVAAAQDSVDLTHVNFTLGLVCDLNVLYDVCNFHQALPYYDSLLTAAENGARLRIMVEQSSIDGVEATVGMRIFLEEAARRGVSDQIEIRFFNGWMHYKSVLVDNQFLVIGSQNFHYSAFGKGTGLTEYNLGTDDPQAIEDYKRLFEYHWKRAVPVSE